jgi:hypothetical protein
MPADIQHHARKSSGDWYNPAFAAFIDKLTPDVAV